MMNNNKCIMNDENEQQQPGFSVADPSSSSLEGQSNDLRGTSKTSLIPAVEVLRGEIFEKVLKFIVYLSLILSTIILLHYIGYISVTFVLSQALADNAI
jgi:hypothetical protein